MASVKCGLDSLLTEHEVARITGMSVATVRRWRLFRQGPPYRKLNSAVRYSATELTAWIESQPKGGGQPVEDPR
jgi:predicted DNA-binding transcriptional regulator AlpA